MKWSLGLLVVGCTYVVALHYTRNRPGGIGYNNQHYTRHRLPRDHSDKTDEREREDKKECDCDYGGDAILLKVGSSPKEHSKRPKRYIWYRRSSRVAGNENDVNKYRNKPSTRRPAAEENVRNGRDGRKKEFLASRVEREDGCDCQDNSSTDSMTRTEDYDANRRPPAIFAQPWPEDEEDDQNKNEDGNNEYENPEESPCDDDPEGSATEEPDHLFTKNIEKSQESPTDDCTCVSIFQCGVSYKMGGTSAEKGTCPEDQVCCPSFKPHPSVEPTPTAPSIKPLECGFSRPNIDIRASESGADRAMYGEFPWTVLITRFDQVVCAGALIHPTVVLTAANCIFNQTLDSVTVYAGAWDVDLKMSSPVQARLIDTYVIHPAFKNMLSLANNIALLRLGDPVDLGDTVNTVCPSNDKRDLDMTRCVATGWGTLPQAFPSDPPRWPKIMKKFRLPYFNREECQTMLRREFFGKTFRLSDGIFCAGGEKNVDMCAGDGGAPYVCPLRNGGMSLVGIVAGGIGCGKANVPGFYLDVNHYRPWLSETMSQLLQSN